MYELYTADEMKRNERYTIAEVGIPSIVLMEKAAEAVFAEVQRCNPEGREICVVVGSGNNGADGIAAARMLHLHGEKVVVYAIGNENNATEEYKLQRSIYEKIGGCITDKYDFNETGTVVDAMLGIGLSRELGGRYAEVCNALNDRQDIVKVAIDIPTGINADDGCCMGTALRCDITVCIGDMKAGAFLKDGPEYTGRVICRDINIIRNEQGSIKVLEDTDVSGLVGRRHPVSNKGTYGKLLIIAGSDNMPGASVLCSRAAFKSGAGMVRLVTSSLAGDRVIKAMPEVMISNYDRDNITDYFRWCDCILIGPGLGGSKSVEELLIKVLRESGKTVIVDADALAVLGDNMDILNERRDCATIVTPHPKEFSRLFKTDTLSKMHQNVSFVKKMAAEYGIIIVAKDHTSLITDGNNIYANINGTDALATAGTGDVLAGLIGCLAMNGEDILKACAASAYIHGKAGCKAAEKASNYAVTASDVIDGIVDVMKSYE